MHTHHDKSWRRFQLSNQAYVSVADLLADGYKPTHWLIRDVCIEYAQLAQVKGGRNMATGRRLKRK